jgi:hypothetical protein
VIIGDALNNLDNCPDSLKRETNAYPQFWTFEEGRIQRLLAIKGTIQNLAGEGLIWDKHWDAIKTLYSGLHKPNVLDMT